LAGGAAGATGADGAGGGGAATVSGAGFAAGGGTTARCGGAACGAAAAGAGGLAADSGRVTTLAEGARGPTGARATDAVGADATGRSDDDRSPDSPQIASTMAAAAATALPPKMAVRFHFHPTDPPLAPFVAGTLVSPQRPLSISCIHGRSSRSFSSACVTMLSTDAGTARRRRIGVGGSARCFARTASRVGAWNGGPPQNTS